MNAPTKTYDSPLRRRQQAATRDAILEATGLLVETEGLDALSYAAIAAKAGVQERTVYRHFPTKGDLLEAFWRWVNDQAGIGGFPVSEAELLRLPPEVYARFDERAGMMAALVFSEGGRKFRLRVNEERQDAYRALLAERTEALDPDVAQRLRAVVQLLYSATAWATLRDHWGLDGRSSAETVSWAIRCLVDAAARGDLPTPSHILPAQRNE